MQSGSLTACILPSKELFHVKNGEKIVRKLVPANSSITLNIAEPVNSVDVLDDRVRLCTMQ